MLLLLPEVEECSKTAGATAAILPLSHEDRILEVRESQKRLFSGSKATETQKFPSKLRAKRNEDEK